MDGFLANTCTRTVSYENVVGILTIECFVADFVGFDFAVFPLKFFVEYFLTVCFQFQRSDDMMIPVFMLYIILWGLFAKRDVYNDFLDGAKDGLKTVAGICPALIGLLTGVGILRGSGFLDFVGNVLGKLTSGFGIPSEILPLTIVRMFSSSAALGLLLDIFKQYGTDSRAGFMGAVILSSTESLFYCMSVYFAAVKIEKTRYTLPGALLATLTGTVTAIVLTGMYI